MITAGASETRPASSTPLDAGAYAPGTLLADRYRIVALAGRGGMGQVYRADDLRLGQAVALKFLPPGLEADPAARERLLAEVRNARTVSHPNVCRVYDFGEIEARTFLTMEYIDGEDLRSLLRRIGRVPPDKALEIARQLAAGLASAHDRGVLHRDLKPANIMIDGRGQARITDFGLAADARPGAAPVDFAGTIAYMAPEQFHGKPATVQSDLYSLGLVLYEACTGRPAFTATSVGEWERVHSDSTPTSPSALVSEIDPAVERAILRCLEKDPARRPASARQLAIALPGGDPLAAAVAAGETPSPQLVAASGEEGTLPRWQAWLWLAACVAAFSVMMLVGAWWSPASRVILPHPELQQERARQILRDLGYGEPHADAGWWMRRNLSYLEHYRAAADDGRALLAAATHPTALLFCYRHGPAPLFNLAGRLSPDDPAPVESGDAYVELGTDGRLVELRVVPSRREAPSSTPGAVDWSPLLVATRVDASRLSVVEPEWGPVHAFDARAAWEGVSDGEPVRVEAAARHGRVTYLRVAPTSVNPSTDPSGGRRTASAWFAAFSMALVLGTLAFAVILAVHNLRLGRGDRRSAYRLSAFVFTFGVLGSALVRHWVLAAGTPEMGGGSPILWQVVMVTAWPLFFAVETWLAYVGFEPYVRRRWPQLLISSMRLLDGRWRDPLVGRALLTGVVAAPAGIAFAFIGLAIVRALGWGVVLPAVTLRGLEGIIAFTGYMALTAALQVVFAIDYLAVLALARVLLRSARAAWMALIAVFFGLFATWSLVFLGPSPAALVIFVLALGVTSVFVLWKGGVLALTVWLVVVTILRDTPWTLALTRWYAGPTWLALALIVGLAVWGFRNVLGRQPLFPAARLDE